MQRRTFMTLSTTLTLTTSLCAFPPSRHPEYHAFVAVKALIQAVQAHLFPPHSLLPSATAMDTIAFTQATLFHPSYDRDIRHFIIEGAKVLEAREKGKFITYTPEQKEHALRTYEKSDYGRNWLSRIMIVTLEALLSDPIYGSNQQERSWKALHTKGGEPRPTTRYIAL